MDSVENGATIRIGIYRHYFESECRFSDVDSCSFSMKIDKKTIIKSGVGYKINNRLEYFENAALDCAKVMNERGVENFVLYNGEKIDWVTNRWESCKRVPKDGEDIFKKTLEKFLY